MSSTIGEITGFGETYTQWKRERAADRRRKQAKVNKLINRARSCKTFDGLERVADDARKMGLWHPVAKTVGQCNARLRGRHYPVRYRCGDSYVTVFDNQVQDVPAWFSAQNPRDLCKEGWLYAGKAD